MFNVRNTVKTSLPYFRVKLSCVCLIEKKEMTYSDPMVTYSHPKMTYSYPKVTYSDPKMTLSELQVTHSDPIPLPIPPPASPGYNLAISYV